MIYLGCSQWHYGFWEDTIYQGKEKSKHHLHYYSKEFNCVELNSTYYQPVDTHTLIKWKTSVPAEFRFCPKFPKEITHDRRLRNVETITDDFIESIKTFDDNLGISFLQLPPSFHASDLYLLDEILTYIDKRIKLSIEIRQDMLAQAGVLIECMKILKKHNAGIVMVDGADTVKYLNSLKLTNSTAFIRFLTYDHPTDYQRLDDWINLIRFWRSKELKEIYFIVHFADGPHEPGIVKYAKDKFALLE